MSTEEQKKYGISIDAQKRDLLKYCESVPEYHVIGIYDDGGFSGGLPYHKRPAQNRLIEDVKAGKVDVIVFTKLDRWSRDIQNYYEVQKILNQNHVTWHCTQEDYKTQAMTPTDEIQLDLGLVLAKFERKMDSQRIKAVNEFKKDQGIYIGSCPPFGYKLVDKKIMRDEKTEKLTERFFEVFMNTGSITEAMDEINAITGSHEKKSTWYVRLHNEMYKGVQGNCHFEDIAYLTAEQFDYIQDIIKSRRKIAPKHKPVHNRMFTGLLKCKECGAALVGKTCCRGSKKYIYYYCDRRNRHGDCENTRYTIESKVEQDLIDLINDRMNGVQIPEELQLNEKSETEIFSKIEVVESKLERLKELYVDGDIDKETYAQKKEDLQNKINALKADIKTDPISIKLPDNWLTIYNELTSKSKHLFWLRLIDKIWIDKDQNALVVWK